MFPADLRPAYQDTIVDPSNMAVRVPYPGLTSQTHMQARRNLERREMLDEVKIYGHDRHLSYSYPGVSFHYYRNDHIFHNICFLQLLCAQKHRPQRLTLHQNGTYIRRKLTVVCPAAEVNGSRRSNIGRFTNAQSAPTYGRLHSHAASGHFTGLKLAPTDSYRRFRRSATSGCMSDSTVGLECQLSPAELARLAEPQPAA